MVQPWWVQREWAPRGGACQRQAHPPHPPPCTLTEPLPCHIPNGPWKRGEKGFAGARSPGKPSKAAPGPKGRCSRTEGRTPIPSPAGLPSAPWLPRYRPEAGRTPGRPQVSVSPRLCTVSPLRSREPVRPPLRSGPSTPASGPAPLLPALPTWCVGAPLIDAQPARSWPRPRRGAPSWAHGGRGPRGGLYGRGAGRRHGRGRPRR